LTSVVLPFFLTCRSARLETLVDDDIVQQVSEGQDMLAEVTEACRLQTSTTCISTPPMATRVVRLTY
jgi:hypothetical protein